MEPNVIFPRIRNFYTDKKKKESGTEFIVLFSFLLIDDTRTATSCNFFPSHRRTCDFFHRALSTF